MSSRLLVMALLMQTLTVACIACPQNRDETGAQALTRHQRVAKRRSDVHVICHRGAVEFAHENTMEAYRAAFELGADGNEIDIRATKDDVLVCFHDDMVDHLLNAYGDVSDYTWEQLQELAFRNPGRYGHYCRIPTLLEVFQLHREYAGLMHLDVKRPGLVNPISKLLGELDMWDHVVLAPADFSNPRIQRTSGKVGLYLDRAEVDVSAIALALKKPGKRIILEDPRGVSIALGRTVRTPSTDPVRKIVAAWANRAAQSLDKRSNEQLLKILSDADGWNVVATESSADEASAATILRRAQAADEIARRNICTPEVFSILEERVRNRSLHRNWRHCGLDGIAAMRALIALKAPRSIELARFCLWRDDPTVLAAKNPAFKNPRSWTDWRTKTPIFELLKSMPGTATEQLCRDYLLLSDSDAERIGVQQFESASRTLLSISPLESTVDELLNHRLSVVRGRAILFCLANKDQKWAEQIADRFMPREPL